MGAYFVYAFFIFIAIAIALTVWNDWKEGKLRKKEYMQRQALMVQQQESLGSNIPLVKNIGTRDLFLDTLTKLGCQYQLGEGEDNRIFFAYQGEHFFADTTNDIKYVHLWDTHWGHVDLYDIDEVCRFRKAINLSNLNTSVTTVFTIDEDGKNMDIHSKSTIPFLSSMPDLDDYLRVELNDFFRAHQVVGNEMNKLREKEHKA
jgi:hypothetical protein